MEKNEIIFIIAAAIVYLICAFAFKMSSYIHLIFAALVLVAILIGIIFKYQQKFENKRIVQYMDMLEIIIILCFVITMLYEIFIGNTVYDLSIFIILFFIVMFCKWFFGKNN